MKTIQIRKGSWHWWVAETFGGWKEIRSQEKWSIQDGKRRFDGYENVQNTDFCAYARRFVVGMLVVVLLSSMLISSVATIGLMQYALIKALLSGAWSKDASTGLTMLILMVLLGVVLLFLKWRSNTKYKRRAAKEAKLLERELRLQNNSEAYKVPFLKHAWTSLREKTCFRMEVQ